MANEVVTNKAVEVVQSQLPASNLDEPASRDYVDARITDLQEQILDLNERIAASTIDESLERIDPSIDRIVARIDHHTRVMVFLLIAGPTAIAVIKAFLGINPWH